MVHVMNQRRIRPLAFESLFSINCRIWDFVGDTATFCLDIKQEFFIFQCFTKKFEFYNLTIIKRKKSLRMEKFASGKPALRSSMSTRIL